MILIIAGSRSAGSEDVLKAIEFCTFINGPEDVSVVFSGMAQGADRFGEHWARLHSIPIRRFPANWSAYGRSAGPIRNKEMAESADALLAVWDGKSKGTKSMIDIAQKAGIRVAVFHFDTRDYYEL